MKRMTRQFSIGLASVFLCCLLAPISWVVLPSSQFSGNYYSVGFAGAAHRISNEDLSNATVDLAETDDVLEPSLTFKQILARAGKKGLGGGIPGAIAGVVQVFTLMGLRTVINYQMRYGTSFASALDVLYKVSLLPANSELAQSVRRSSLRVNRMAEFSGFIEESALLSFKLRCHGL